MLNNADVADGKHSIVNGNLNRTNDKDICEAVETMSTISTDSIQPNDSSSKPKKRRSLLRDKLDKTRKHVIRRKRRRIITISDVCTEQPFSNVYTISCHLYSLYM